MTQRGVPWWPLSAEMQALWGDGVRESLVSKRRWLSEDLSALKLYKTEMDAESREV